MACYVYRLVDPRDGSTFYVGKGTGNRVFAHARGESKRDETTGLPQKLNTIREIRLSGQKVIAIIHRHGMDHATAIEVEAALIDAYPALTNLVGGHGSAERGAAPAKDILLRYQAERAVMRHNCLIVSVEKSLQTRSVYDAARFAWKLNRNNLAALECVLAVKRGLIVGVFQPVTWLSASRENFPEFGEDLPHKWGFQGVEAPPPIREIYLDKRLPSSLTMSQQGFCYATAC